LIMKDHNRNQALAVVLCACIVALVVFVALLCLMLTGCSVLPQNKTTTSTTAEHLEAAHNLSVQRAVEGDQRPNVSLSVCVSGSSNAVAVQFPNGQMTQPYHETLDVDSGENTSVSNKLTGTLKQALPWGISLLLIGAGVLLIIYAYKSAQKASPAIAAAFSTAETAIVGQLNKVDEKLDRARTAEEQADLAMQARALERERASLRAKHS